MIAQIMKRLILMIAAIWSVAVCLSAQGFGYSYGAGREDVQGQTPIAEPGAGRPEAVWAVSGNLQPFGTCANDLDPPPYGPSRAGRRKPPPTTGGQNPENPKLHQPIGDVDVWCGLALLIYVLRIACRKRKQSTAITE